MDLHVKLSPLEVKITGGGSGQDSSAVLAEIRMIHIELHAVTKQLEKIMASNSELQASLEGIESKLDEASGEIVAKLAELRALIVASGPGTTPQIDALISNLTTKVTALADVANADPPG